MDKYGGGNHLFSAVKHVQYQDAKINAVVWILFGKLWQKSSWKLDISNFRWFYLRHDQKLDYIPMVGCYITDSIFLTPIRRISITGRMTILPLPMNTMFWSPQIWFNYWKSILWYGNRQSRKRLGDATSTWFHMQQIPFHQQTCGKFWVINMAIDINRPSPHV